ncbi:FAD-dependent oxidoreductase, partial [Kocuria rosea]
MKVVVIGAGQAGLSAAHHLRRRGLVPEEDFVVLDANPGPGGAWRHRWPSLTFGGAHGIHDLPGLPLGVPDPAEPASAVVARYYGEYERRFALPVHRPVAVRRVEAASDDGPLEVVADTGTWRTELVINGTGTW